jgi:16S rRNA C1402 N4-methylase RsmH
VCDAVQTVRLVRRVPRTPSAAEQADNRRAQSARLRVAERIADTPRRGTVG